MILERVSAEIERVPARGRGFYDKTHAHLLEVPEGKLLVEPTHQEHEFEWWAGLIRDHAERGTPILAFVYTHWHHDHTGGAARLQESTGIPIWGPPLLVKEPFRVDRTLLPGDAVGRWIVLSAKGHALEQIAFTDGETIISGDATSTLGDGRPHEYVETMRAFAALRPKIVLPAHGEPFLHSSFNAWISSRMQEPEMRMALADARAYESCEVCRE